MCVCLFVCLGGCYGGASTEAQQNLLTVLEGASVSHALQGALGLSQEAGTVPGWSQQGHREVSAGQEDGVSSFSLA